MQSHYPQTYRFHLRLHCLGVSVWHSIGLCPYQQIGNKCLSVLSQISIFFQLAFVSVSTMFLKSVSSVSKANIFVECSRRVSKLANVVGLSN